MTTKDERANAMKLIAEKRSVMQMNRSAATTPHAGKTAGEWIEDALPKKVTTRPAQSARPVDESELKKYFGLKSLDELTVSHMRDSQAMQFNSVLAGVRQWRDDVRSRPGLSAIIASHQVGIGKTHIAKSVMSSFCEIITEHNQPPHIAADGSPNFRLAKRGKMYTARNIMDAWSEDGVVNLWELVKPHYTIVIIDDVGREGTLKYIKHEEQLTEKQNRYYQLINFCYERNEANRPVSLFITSNLTLDRLAAFFGDATWSRLNQMAPRGYMWQLSGLEDFRMVASGR